MNIASSFETCYECHEQHRIYRCCVCQVPMRQAEHIAARTYYGECREELAAVAACQVCWTTRGNEVLAALDARHESCKGPSIALGSGE